MELKDFVVTPIVLFIVYVLAYVIRPKVTDHNTRRYFIPALTVKIIGAIAVGFIYQFYYGGGDTFNFYKDGTYVWRAIINNPLDGIELLFANGEHIPGTYEYASKIYFYRDPSSYAVIRISAIAGLVTFNTYSATAVLFALFAFSGCWALYLVFYEKFSTLYFGLAIAVLFIPSVFFWGSGILKDTITLGALGWCTYAVDKIFIKRRKFLLALIILAVSLYLIFSIKKYIMLCFVPAAIIWVFASHFHKIRSIVLKILIMPAAVTIVSLLAYFAVLEVGENDSKYAINNIAQTAKITAYDLAYWTGRDAGSTYTLGELDGTFESMIKLAPAAVNVTLFRPYLWEINNPLMALAGFESFLILVLTLYVIYRSRIVYLLNGSVKPLVLFCLTFSIVFAFAVGVSTFNFGTLVRYKIPLMPFYVSALVILANYSKSNKKLLQLEVME